MRGPRPRNQVVKYYLSRWYYFDTHMDYLNEVDLIKMKILYKSLKELSSEERKFLADKYRVERRPYIKDIAIAIEIGMPIKAYQEKRIRIEDKLRPILLKHKESYTEEFSQACKLVHGG